MNKRHYEHTLPNIRGSLSNTYETTSFFRIAVPSFYRLSRQSVANPFPPVTCGREIGIRFCKQNRMVCFTFRTALFLVFCLP